MKASIRISARPILYVLTAILTMLTLSQATIAGTLRPRVPHLAPKHITLREGNDPRRVFFKLDEGTGARLRGGRMEGRGTFRASMLAGVLARHGLHPENMARLFGGSELALDLQRAEGERRSQRQLADLNLYYELTLPPGANAAALCDELNTLPFVEFAEPALLPAPPPIDLAPPTPSFFSSQGYRSAAPLGIGIDEVGAIPGADGAGVRIADIEYSWVLDHEDLELGPSAVIPTGTPSDPFGDSGNHGTAVLGELVGISNGYGITGLVPAAGALVAAANTLEHGYNLPRAVNLASAALSAGDVLLIEQQTSVCGGGYGPVEWDFATFDAIRNATALGIVVVEAAGNGNVNLDAPDCLGRFDRSQRDSGAVIVGAGYPGTRSRLDFSSYGSRVDVQGWGISVSTSGYGNAFDPGDVRQRYTLYFSGTSSASPIVAGAAVSIQGARMASGAAPLDPEELRSVLVQTGTPQDPADLSGAIGPLPNVPEVLALCATGNPTPTINLTEGFLIDAFEPITLELSLRNCGQLEGAATLTVETPEGVLAARDDGVAPDQAAGDGLHSLVWTPRHPGAVSLIVEGRASGVSARRSISGEVQSIPVYEALPAPFGWIDATRGSPLALAFDDASVEVPLGFPFSVYGETHESVRVSSNGYLTFGTAGEVYANAPIPSVQAPNALVAAYWDDLNPGLGGGVYLLAEGVAPKRRVTIEWHAVPYYAEPAATATFQVTLFESGSIRFQYLDVASGAAASGASATAGIENPDGTRGVSVNHDTPGLMSGTAIQIAVAPACRDGRDNDGDGARDFPADPGCRDASSATEQPQCQDGRDNDNRNGIDFDGGASLDIDDDGFVDVQFNPAAPPVGGADPQCTAAWGNLEAVLAAVSCGVGPELALLMPALWWVRRVRRLGR